MAALLVSLAVMSVLMSVASRVGGTKPSARSEAGAGLPGRAVRARDCAYRAKNANAFPPSVDVLVQGKFLRKSLRRSSH